ncbi:MAG: hypothetical protein ACNS62_12775 [Candidatus Cyclobacteriaceae bacterium M3_2C_046]
MDFKRIEILLEKYWQAETSLQEEQELHHFFQKVDIPDHMKDTAVLFQYFQKEQEELKLDEKFDQDILEDLETEEKPIGRKAAMFDLNKVWKMAAVIALVISFVIGYQYLDQSNHPAVAELGTYEDPEAAYEETKKALLLISAQLNKGQQYAQEITRIHEAKEKVEKLN